jgi:hypothetical protein
MSNRVMHYFSLSVATVYGGMKMKSIIKRAFMLLVFGIVLMNTAAATSTIKLSDFTSGASPTDGLGDAKPLMLEVVAIVIGLFLATYVIAVFTSGSTANIGSIVHNVSLRSRGLAGVVTVAGVIFAVIFTLVLFLHLYNKFLAGM